MVRGTRVMFGDEARRFSEAAETLRRLLHG